MQNVVNDFKPGADRQDSNSLFVPLFGKGLWGDFTIAYDIILLFTMIPQKIIFKQYRV
jgi:hypothetical protein